MKLWQYIYINTERITFIPHVVFLDKDKENKQCNGQQLTSEHTTNVVYFCTEYDFVVYCQFIIIRGISIFVDFVGIGNRRI